MKDGCGFLFVRYKRHFCTELISWEHVACPLSGIKRRPLVGGWLNTSCIVFSIRAIASVRYREVVRSWEGPLWEAPLYTCTVKFMCTAVYMHTHTCTASTCTCERCVHSIFLSRRGCTDYIFLSR